MENGIKKLYHILFIFASLIFWIKIKRNLIRWHISVTVIGLTLRPPNRCPTFPYSNWCRLSMHIPFSNNHIFIGSMKATLVQAREESERTWTRWRYNGTGWMKIKERTKEIIHNYLAPLWKLKLHNNLLYPFF